MNDLLLWVLVLLKDWSNSLESIFSFDKQVEDCVLLIDSIILVIFMFQEFWMNFVFEFLFVSDVNGMLKLQKYLC